MKTVKIAELKDRLSEHIRSVERGTVSEVIVTDRDRPVARIVPIEQSASRVTILPPAVPFATVRGTRRKPAGWKISSLDLLLEERGDR
jgi:prevent-host-death family protein